MLNGWGGYVLAHANDGNVFFSHDEYIDFFAHNPQKIAEARTALAQIDRPRT